MEINSVDKNKQINKSTKLLLKFGESYRVLVSIVVSAQAPFEKDKVALCYSASREHLLIK